VAITRQWAYKNKEIERIVLSGLEKIDLGLRPGWVGGGGGRKHEVGGKPPRISISIYARKNGGCAKHLHKNGLTIANTEICDLSHSRIFEIKLISLLP